MPSQEIEVTLFSGDEPLEVVGESYYQENLEQALDALGREVAAILHPDFANPHDPNAVAVLVGGKLVGHLSRDNAALYQREIARLIDETGKPVAVMGRIVGGVSGKPTLGIWLTHDPEDFGLHREQASEISAVSAQFNQEADRAVTDEAERLARLSSKGLDPSGQPYEARFNRARRAERDISELLGLCRGFLADGEVSDSEVRLLHDWLERYADGAEDWIVAQIVRRVKAVLEDGVISSDERSELTELLASFTGGTGELILGEDPRATNLPLDMPAPDLQCSGAVFVFTGKFAFGPRQDCERATQALGGTTERSVTKRTQYLVIGTFGSRDWVHTAYGRKIQKAAEYRAEGVPLAIVCEDHWRKWLS